MDRLFVLGRIMIVKRLWTTSPFKVWLLTTFFGYKVRYKSLDIRYGSENEMYHVQSWLLCPARAALQPQTVEERKLPGQRGRSKVV